jgi:chemotaxis protein MotA
VAATSASLVTRESSVRETHDPTRPNRLDRGIIAGLILAASAFLTGLAFTGIKLTYFFNPAAAVLVIGGTLAVLVITTPLSGLGRALNRVLELVSVPYLDREQLSEEIIHYAQIVRQEGLLAIEPQIKNAHSEFLRDALLMALDVKNRAELLAGLETELRLMERQGETDAKVVEVAGGFVPTLGIIGTVMGLIDVMHHFSDFGSVGSGIGTAFVSTIYGLVLANLLLLPISHRMRSRVAATFEIQELIIEGVLCLYDELHPTLVRLRLAAYLRSSRSNMERNDKHAETRLVEPRK